MVQRHLVLTLLGLICGSVPAYLPKRSTTITIPDGVTYHPESQDICTSTSRTDIVSFFLGNYLSHVATVVRAPGEPLHITILNMLLVLLFPSFRAGRGLITIYRRARFYKDPLQQALKAQALVMVIRDREWTPQAGDSIRSLSLQVLHATGPGSTLASPHNPYHYSRLGRYLSFLPPNHTKTISSRYL